MTPSRRRTLHKTDCRICKGTDLHCFLDLGFHPHSDLFRPSLDEEESHYPLRLVRCRGCGFVQLDYVVPPSEMYQTDYLYESSITETGSAHWAELADTVSKKLGLAVGDGVIDIGSNDGTLLSKFAALGMRVHGIDPCGEIADIAIGRGIPTVKDFFSADALRAAMEGLPNTKLITGTNVFAHIDDLDAILDAVASNLGDGVFVFESPYFGNFFEEFQYDTVYHQHLSYLSLRPLISFFEKYELPIFDVERTSIHGGSFRVYAGRGRERTAAVENMLASENWTDEDKDAFSAKVRQNRDDLFDLIYSLWKEGKTVAAVSCPAKGQTLLNYTGVGRFLSFATDKSKLKQGRYTPGTHMMIYSDEALIEQQPDYALLLAWNFADEIIRNNKNYEGRWIVPIPHPTIR
jgi:hypothetical protein